MSAYPIRFWSVVPAAGECGFCDQQRNTRECGKEANPSAPHLSGIIFGPYALVNTGVPDLRASSKVAPVIFRWADHRPGKAGKVPAAPLDRSTAHRVRLGLLGRLRRPGRR